jgi:hypothetical protein
MKYNEALKVIKSVTIFYQNFIITEEKANEWALLLQEYDFNSIMENLRNYVKVNKFPPTISDLLNQENVSKNQVAYLQVTEETMKEQALEAARLLQQIEEPKKFEQIKVSPEIREQLRGLMNGMRAKK